MKNIYIVCFFCLLIINNSCNCYKEQREPHYEIKKVEYNLVGITGKDSSQPYIELFYSKDSNGQNITVHEWVKPPYLFGGHIVNVKQKIYYPQTLYMQEVKRLICDYNIGGDSYLKIINHSNSSIEMFFINNVNLELRSEALCNDMIACCDVDKAFCKRTILYSPMPIFKNAPLYYLLFPDKIIPMEKVLYSQGREKKDEFIVSFNSNNVGEVILDKKYTINDIMNLYRAEYNNSKDTILYFTYDDVSIKRRLNERYQEFQKMRENQTSYFSSSDSVNVDKFGFYKKINSYGTMFSTIENQLLKGYLVEFKGAMVTNFYH